VSASTDEKNTKPEDLLTGLPDGVVANCTTIWTHPSKSNEQYFVAGCSNGSIVIWDLSTNKKFATITGHGEAVRKVAIRSYSSGNNNTNWEIISYSLDNTIRLWDPNSRKQKATASPAWPINALVVWQNPFVASDWKAFIGCFNGRILAWDGHHLRDIYRHPVFVSSLALWTPEPGTDNKDKPRWVLISGDANGLVCVYDSAKSAITSEMHHNDEPEIVSLAVANMSKGWKVISGCANDFMYLWDLFQPSSKAIPKLPEQIIDMKNIDTPIPTSPELGAQQPDPSPTNSIEGSATTPPPNYQTAVIDANGYVQIGKIKYLQTELLGMQFFDLKLGGVFLCSFVWLIGKGSLETEVYRGYYSYVSNPQGRECAVKVMKKARWAEIHNNRNWYTQIQREFANLELLWNDYPTPPNSIIRYFGVVRFFFLISLGY